MRVELLGSGLATGCLLATIVTCAPVPEEPATLEVEDVDASSTNAMTPEGDRVAVDPGPTLSGALPPAFPADLPIFVPASVSGFSTPDDDVRYVLLHAEAPLGEVQRSLLTLLDRSPWQRVGDDPWQRSKGRHRALYQLEADEVVGTIVRIEY